MRENDREIRRSPLGIDYRTLRGVAGFSLQENDTEDRGMFGVGETAR